MLFGPVVTAQNLEKKADSIMAEAKLLLQLEKASWHATDHFLENFPDQKEQIVGYFSYLNHLGNVATIFYGQEEYQILARYLFEDVPSPESLQCVTENLMISDPEATLYDMRKAAVNHYLNNKEGIYKYYNDVNPNFIPLNYGGDKKVYIISGTSENKMLIGNDYRLEFDEDNQVTQATALHNSLIPYDYTKQQNTITSLHSHVNSAFIDVTDVCTLLLYKDYIGVKKHIVVHKDYVSILDLESENLLILNKEAFDKIAQD